MLNASDYPALAKLTKMIKEDSSFSKLTDKKEQVKHLRNTFYPKNVTQLDNMIDELKKDLKKFSDEVDFTMMHGHHNKVKSDKQ